ncbi:hypothetical protein ALT_8951 [Aspergillus lentulus]|uniref:Uncharacterized protein n=1 Tax=Aspergillus lentulus TaxID=293939 RepID=A0AAN4TF94_ASPLE|nr:hypothetical protein ALT_8951 [Aspergillus lentulus]
MLTRLIVPELFLVFRKHTVLRIYLPQCLFVSSITLEMFRAACLRDNPVWSVPNLILPFCSGPAVQRHGEGAVLLITVTSMMAGQFVIALAVQMRSQLALILGRGLIELGGVVIGVLASEIITRWFKYAASLMVITFILVVGFESRRIPTRECRRLDPHPEYDREFQCSSATWMGTLLSLGAIAISVTTLLALTNAVSRQTTAPDTGSAVPVRQLPRIYWHLSLICVLEYGGINTFTNSTQRFLASWFYHGNQRTAGLATNCLHALFTSNFLLALAHLRFICRVMPILPLCLLGIAFALYGVAFWAAVAQSSVFASRPQNSNSTDNSSVREFGTEKGVRVRIHSIVDSDRQRRDAQGDVSDGADTIHQDHEGRHSAGVRDHDQLAQCEYGRSVYPAC